MLYLFILKSTFKHSMSRSKSPQLAFPKVNGWGGKRRGAGRPSRSGRVNHMKRAKVNFQKPLHITMKLASKNWSLRCGDMYGVFKRNSERAKRFGLNIVHYSLLKDHLHLIVEVKDNKTLALAMRSFASGMAKGIRAFIGGRGEVFNGRFHMRAIENPTQMRNTVIYVLQNQAKHQGVIDHFDQYSSAWHFKEWKKLAKARISPLLYQRARSSAQLPPHLSAPRSWLAREGWRRG